MRTGLRLDVGRRRWISTGGIHGVRSAKQVPVLRGGFHGRCAQSRAPKNIAAKRRVEQRARQHASAAGGSSPSTKIISVDRNTSSGYGSGERPIRGIGARTGAAGGLRYKMHVVQAVEKSEDLSACALQDALQCQGPILIGLIAQLTIPRYKTSCRIRHDVLYAEPSIMPNTAFGDRDCAHRP
jgi:hypothetical protein